MSLNGSTSGFKTNWLRVGLLEQDIKSFGLRLIVKGLKQKEKDRFCIYALINICIISLIFFLNHSYNFKEIHYVWLLHFDVCNYNVYIYVNFGMVENPNVGV